MEPAHHALRLEELRLAVHLGCTDIERRERQEVRLSVELRFARPPAGTRSDLLEDTVCYARVAHALRAHIEAREYALIEKLGADAYAVIKDIVGREVAVWVNVHKVRPPVRELLGGAHYVCGDFLR